MSVIYGELSALSSESIPFEHARRARINCREMAETLKDRIRQRLKDLELTARAASIAAGLNADTVGKVLLDKTKNLRGDNLSSLARVLQTTESWLVYGKNSETGITTENDGVEFGGIVEAGAFRSVDLLDQIGGRMRIVIAADPRFPASAQHAFKAEGDSMTLAGIHPGMYVLAVEIHAWERVMGEPNDGRLVVVARTRNGSPERELTVKRLRIFRDRIELQPESSNTFYQPLVFQRPAAEDGETDVQIVAVVLQSVQVY
jgi:SOS-response transcriptional repressor LexA